MDNPATNRIDSNEAARGFERPYSQSEMVRNTAKFGVKINYVFCWKNKFGKKTVIKL